MASRATPSPEVLGLVFAISAGFLIFLALHLSRVKKRYIKEIRNHPESLFPSWTCKREIVGRDALCGLIDDDFTDRGRSPSRASTLSESRRSARSGPMRRRCPKPWPANCR